MLGNSLFMVTVDASRIHRVTFGEMATKVLAPFLDPDDTSSRIKTNALSIAQIVPVFLILIKGSSFTKWAAVKSICMPT